MMSTAEPDDSAASFLRDALGPSLARLSACRAEAATPETIHQARVATRRTRANLKDLRAVFGDGWDGDVRPELAWIGGLLGGVRDADVLATALETELDRADERVRRSGGVLVAEVRRDRERALEDLVYGLGHPRFLAVVDHLAALIDAPPVPTGVEVEPAVVMSPAWRALKRGVRALPPDPSDPELHAVRIATKRARYAADMFQTVAGPGARRFARRAGRMQDALGRHQDAVVAVTWLRAREGTGPGVAFAAGWLAARFEAARDADRHAWRDPWEALARPEARFW
jgi:CHAD domain-containing protein